jgi:hypothetical protein
MSPRPRVSPRPPRLTITLLAALALACSADNTGQNGVNCPSAAAAVTSGSSDPCVFVASGVTTGFGGRGTSATGAGGSGGSGGATGFGGAAGLGPATGVGGNFTTTTGIGGAAGFGGTLLTGGAAGTFF